MPKVVRLEDRPGSSLQMYTTSRPGEAIGTIAIPTRDKISVGLFISLMSTDWKWLGENVVEWAVVQGSILVSQRNELVQRMKGDWILFIDADMQFDPNAIQQLIAAREEGDFDILGGLCFQRSEPYQPTMYMRERPDSGGYLFLERWDDDIVEVDGTGLAFVIVHRRVFERIVRHNDNRPAFVWPPYEERIRIQPPDFFKWIGGLGEDLRFCQDAKASGSRIYVDTRIKIGHVGETVYDERSFFQGLALRNPEDEAMRRKLNDKLGLPTVTAAEARERL